MTRRSYALGLALGPALFLVGPLVAVSCSGSGGGADVVPNAACTNGTIQLISCLATDGGMHLEPFTDEACQGLDTAEGRHAPAADDTRAPVIDTPTEAQAVPGATAFNFTWHPTPAFSLRRAPDEGSPRRMTFAQRVEQLFTLLPAAEAHCPAFGGVAYAVIFTADNNQVLLRAETATHFYLPTAEAWGRLTAARGVIAMTVEAARFSQNDVTEGPVVRVTPRHFTITP